MERSLRMKIRMITTFSEFRLDPQVNFLQNIRRGSAGIQLVAAQILCTFAVFRETFSSLDLRLEVLHFERHDLTVGFSNEQRNINAVVVFDESVYNKYVNAVL